MSRIALRLVVAAVGVATMLLGVGTTAVEGDPGRGWDARAVATSYFDQRQNQRGIVPSAASNVATDVTESPGAIHVRVEHYLHGIRVADATSVASMHAGAAQPHFVRGAAAGV